MDVEGVESWEGCFLVVIVMVVNSVVRFVGEGIDGGLSLGGEWDDVGIIRVIGFLRIISFGGVGEV